MAITKKKKFVFRLKGKTLVLIDWANVYGWEESLGWKVSPRKLYAYLRSYKQIRQARFYYGKDRHRKSVEFLRKMKKLGFTVITKEVKYVPVTLDKSYFRKIVTRFKQNFIELKLTKYQQEKLLGIISQTIFRRKCDFDIEIAMDFHKFMDKFDGFILFSGDGDYAPLLELCLKQGKQVIVVFAPGHLGKEIRKLEKKRIFFCSVNRLKDKMGR